MTILSNIKIVLVFTCIVQLVLVADCRKGQSKNERGSRSTGRASKTAPIEASYRNEKERKTLSVKGVFKGRFSTKDKTQCTWVATGEDAFTLGVNCKRGGGGHFDCEYKAVPTACPEYVSRVKVYWKQIARSLKKQRALCTDPAALVKAGMCRRAPKAAHFKLSNTPSKRPESATRPPPSKGGKLCTEYQRKRAREYCSESWSSLCTILFSMLQGGEDC